jgi:hypothetical protein
MEQIWILLQGSSIASYITSPLVLWFPIVVLAAVAMIGVLAVMYMLGQFAGRESMRVWAKVKIYEILLSLLTVILFLFLVSFIFSLNFQQIFGSVGLVPQECMPSSLTATDFFSLAICNMHQFNQQLLNLNGLIYYISLRLSMVPQLTINASKVIKYVTGISGLGGSITLQPPSAFDTFMGYGLDVLYFAFVLTQVQLLLLAASLLLFSLFMSIGLISRMFVITRSFGGAMVAFGIGLGILFPLMVNLTYGFINVGLDANSSYNNISIFASVSLGIMVAGILGIALAFLIATSSLSGSFTGLLQTVLTFAGLIAVGLTVIPIINFIVIDSFIIDFSQAVGERMSFMSLLTNLI